MNEVVLLIGHGSRDEEGNAQFLSAVSQMQQRMPQWAIEACFLEFASPNVSEGVRRCVLQGAARITAVPVLLLDAGHFTTDMPRELALAAQRFPQAEIRYGRHLGFHEKIFRLLLQVLRAAGESPEAPREHTALLMVGRGSSDAVANSNFYKMSRLLWERTAYTAVENCFIGITRPTLDEGLERCFKLGMEEVVVVPYFLFTGRLVKRIEAKVEEVRGRHPDVEFRLMPEFGLEQLLLDMLEERIREAVAGEASAAYCENCRMREMSEGTTRYAARLGHSHDHGHAHHHHHPQGQHSHGGADAQCALKGCPSDPGKVQG